MSVFAFPVMLLVMKYCIAVTQYFIYPGFNSAKVSEIRNRSEIGSKNKISEQKIREIRGLSLIFDLK